MSEQKSVMVVATRFQLLVKDTESVERAQLGAYLISGQKKALSNPKAIARSYAEARNEEPNNEYWAIDEEATKEFYKIRDKRIKEKARRGNAKKLTTDDIVMSLLNKLDGNQPEEEVKKEEKPVVEEPVVEEPEEEKEEEEVVPDGAEETPDTTGDDNTGSEEETPAPKPNYKRMNKTELKAICDTRKIEYDSEASNAKLAEALEDFDVEAAKEGGES